MIFKKMKFIPILLSLVVYAGCDRKLPSFVEQCYRNDPKVSKCLIKNIESLRPKLAEGIPELFVPSLSPLKVDRAELHPDKSFNIDLYNIKLYNLDKFDLKNIDIDVKNLKAGLDISWDSVGIDTDYTMKGKLLILAIDTTGHGFGNLTKIKADAGLSLKKGLKKGKEYLTINKMDIDLKIDNYNMSFNKFFGDNPELNEKGNQLLNDNSELFLEEFIPVIKVVVRDIVYKLFENLFRKFSYDTLLPEKPE
ncbi:protein takeout-like [Diabrotica undecimpunctata]|uniref:protein takeout-like n=1 Tax=Diabrotica undecimpunctata TaxID=50387 RepID=UPI003B639185